MLHRDDPRDDIIRRSLGNVENLTVERDEFVPLEQARDVPDVDGGQLGADDDGLLPQNGRSSPASMAPWTTGDGAAGAGAAAEVEGAGIAIGVVGSGVSVQPDRLPFSQRPR